MIEQTLERIATALEKIATNGGGNLQNTNSVNHKVTEMPVKATKTAKTATAPVGAPVVVSEVESVENDPFADAQIGATVTIDMVKDVLAKHARAFGTQQTIDLIKRHGADAVTPKIAGIPAKNFAACIAEAEKDLAKLPGAK